MNYKSFFLLKTESMERRLNNKLSSYLTSFKNDMKEKMLEKLNDNNGNLLPTDCNELIVYMFDYEGFCFTQDDFVKRKRIKNTVPVNDRCCARRANNEQCTRRKKDGFDYCGTHVKGTPNGFMNTDSSFQQPESTKVEVWAQDIKGISYYLDNNGNVYEPEDVVMNRDKPRVIAKYDKNTSGDYIIPSLGIV